MAYDLDVRAALLIPLVWCAAGCSGWLPPGVLPSVPYHTLPSAIDELHDLADHVHSSSRKISDLVRARTALKKAERDGGGYETHWRLARVDGILARLDPENGEAWAGEGRTAGARAITLAPTRVEGHLYYAICLGMAARYRPGDADRLSKALISEAQRATDIDPQYAGGQARRVMGAVYIYAPPWPTGVGDLDEAFDLLEALYTERPDEALNSFYLAEACRMAGENDRALRLYRRVLKYPKRGIWGIEGRPWRREARQHIRRLRRSRRP